MVDVRSTDVLRLGFQSPPHGLHLFGGKRCPCSLFREAFVLQDARSCSDPRGFFGWFFLFVVLLVAAWGFFFKTTTWYQQVTNVLGLEKHSKCLCHHSFPLNSQAVYHPYSPNLISGLIQATHTLDHHILYYEILFHAQTGSSQDESPGSVDLCLSHLQAMHFHLKRNLKTISQGTQQIVTIAMHQSQHGNYTPPGCR